MSPAARAVSWTFVRAMIWIAFISWGVTKSTANWKIGRAYLSAHVAGVVLGGLLDLFLVFLAPPWLLTVRSLQAMFTAPIAVFIVYSLWICNWERPVKIPDVFMSLLPLVLWAMIVIHGWQILGDCDILGAWCVTALAGGVDLFARYGPPQVREHSYWTRLAGYGLTVLVVYLILPHTELNFR